MGTTKAKKYVAFLRGINVGGNTMVPMNELRLLCESLGFRSVRTYIQSGNVIFESGFSEEALRRKLEKALYETRQKQIAVVIRTISELQDIIFKNPFPNANPSLVGVMLFAQPISVDFRSGISTPGREEIRIARREVYIHYPDGMGRSKLKLPKEAQKGTVRNVNTISKLVELQS